MLTDRKRPKQEAVATKTFRYYDVLTGKDTERKVNFQDRKKLREKNMHQAMTERKPQNSFGRSQGIFSKGIDKLSNMKILMRNKKLEKEKEDQTESVSQDSVSKRSGGRYDRLNN